MVTYTDQALGGNFDPGAPPGLPTVVTVISITLNDVDNDGFIRADGSDQVNGSNVTNVWVNDTVTIDGTTHTGTTFYTADGSRYFTPDDGSVLLPGTATSVTFVTSSTQFPVSDLGPPCFTAGTMIETPDGEVRVEDLEIGDLVTTKDHGPQPIRWIGSRKVAGRGEFAPILFKAGAIGNTRDLRVSPQHRMLLQDWRAELFFGEDEVLCVANKLRNDSTILKAPCDEVEYIHLMFDAHEVIYAEGAPSESLLVGEYLCGDGTALLSELQILFPEIQDDPAKFTAAKRVARTYEMQAFVA
ncbi:MAG: Hint domain-containing protein [Marinosulfonomonas sp.]|nr:Hint domain-containing protein [Marinosulfonomonas sp.]